MDPYVQALEVQDASNISGVIHAFADCMKELTFLGCSESVKRNHPVTVLFISKLCNMIPYLVDPVGLEMFGRARAVCEHYLPETAEAV